MVEASQLKSPESPRRWPMLCAVVGLGVAIRLTFLALSGELELWADEAHYVQLAAMWSRAASLSPKQSRAKAAQQREFTSA